MGPVIDKGSVRKDCAGATTSVLPEWIKDLFRVASKLGKRDSNNTSNLFPAQS